jgi:hypothetical protein
MSLIPNVWFKVEQSVSFISIVWFEIIQLVWCFLGYEKM